MNTFVRHVAWLSIAVVGTGALGCRSSTRNELPRPATDVVHGYDVEAVNRESIAEAIRLIKVASETARSAALDIQMNDATALDLRVSAALLENLSNELDSIRNLIQRRPDQ